MTSTLITNADKIVLETPESFLRAQGISLSEDPRERLFQLTRAKEALYSEIVRRLSRICRFILNAEDDSIAAKELTYALFNHVDDPAFTEVVDQYFNRSSESIEQRAGVGALFTSFMSEKLSKKKTIDPKADKETKDAIKAENDKIEDGITHIMGCVKKLLGPIVDEIENVTTNLNKNQVLTVAAAIAMNGEQTFENILDSDIPVTADVFTSNIVRDPSRLVKDALLMSSDKYSKYVSKNQKEFLESLKRWVYNKLNVLTPHQCYNFLAATYQKTKIKRDDKVTEVLFINVKDCGTKYANLLTASKILLDGTK